MTDADRAAKEQIDAMLAALPDDQRAALQSLRETIAAAAPAAVEGLSYGAPAFRYKGRPLVAYSAAKGHCSLFPMGPSMIEAHRAELAGFDTSKGTIRFTPAMPIPPELVARIVRGRISEIESG